MTRRARSLAALILGVTALAGCATRADLLQVKQELRETRALVADQQVAVDGLRRRIDILRNETAEGGRGKGGGAAASSQTQQRLSDLESRIAGLEQARPGTTPGAVAAVPGAPAEAPVDVPQPQPLPATPPAPKAQTPQDIALAKEESAMQGKGDADYREALQLVRQGQCNQAVPKLRDFIRKNAKSDLADNAQYWIGACYYGQRDYSRAIVELNDLILKYQKGDKVPGALLMMADAFADSGDKIDARLVLQKLISQHGGSEEAATARQKLQTLGE